MEILRKIKENIKEAKELENIVKFRQTTSGKLLMRLKKKTQSSEKQSVEELTEETKVKTFKNTNDRIMYIRDIHSPAKKANHPKFVLKMVPFLNVWLQSISVLKKSHKIY